MKGKTGDASMSKSFTGQSTVNARAYFHLSNPVNWGVVQLMSLYGRGSFSGWVTYSVDPSSPTLTVCNGANDTLYSCSVPSLNAWHSLELQYILSTTPSGPFTLWLDGSQACHAGSIVTSPGGVTSIDQLVVGIASADDTAGLTVHVDDVVIKTIYVGP